MRKLILLYFCLLSTINTAWCGECKLIGIDEVNEKDINLYGWTSSSYTLVSQNPLYFRFCGTHHDKKGRDDNKGCDYGDIVYTENNISFQKCDEFQGWKDFFVGTKCNDDLQTVINTHDTVFYVCDAGWPEDVLCYGNKSERNTMKSNSICKYDYDKFNALEKLCFKSGGVFPWSEGFVCYCGGDTNELKNDGPYKCKCIDENKEYSRDLGKCVAKTSIDSGLMDNINDLTTCTVAGTVERNGTCVCSDSNKVIKKGKCEYTAAYVAKIESELDAKYASLSATIGGFEKSVWRDEDGNFNTARLASDSIAGVVLGTVGGIVTSNLVKKAQVKKGFEDIGCYIGGQSVANYGDEFTVGR